MTPDNFVSREGGYRLVMAAMRDHYFLVTVVLI